MFAYYCDYATELVDGFCYQLPDEVDQYVHPSLLYTARCSLKSYRQECNKSKEINQNGRPAFFFSEGQDYRNPRPSRNVLVYSHDADKLPPRGVKNAEHRYIPDGITVRNRRPPRTLPHPRVMQCKK